MSLRDVAVIGPGRVGTALALALARGGRRIVAAVDGGGGSAARLAERIAGCRVHDDPTDAVAAAPVVLVTVPDDEIEAVVTHVAAADGWREHHRVVHCSGAAGLDVLRLAARSGARVAACHPAQTVPAGADEEALLGAAWAVTCAEEDRSWAEELVIDAGGDPFHLPEGTRTLYHAGLSVGSNAVAAAAAVARQLLLAAGIDAPEHILEELATTSVRNVVRDGASALTGPIVRGDVATVRAHLAALDADLPELADDYRALQQVVLARTRAALDEGAAEALDDVLGGSAG